MRSPFGKSFRWAASLAVITATTSLGDDPVRTVRVEEDWVLEVHDADPDTSSPQIATQMMPDGSREDIFALFCLNFHEVPYFTPGGMEIQLWEGEEVIDVDAHDSYELSENEETLRWTQSLQIDSGRLEVQVRNGESVSFGSFGDDSFEVSHETSFENLDSYSVEDTVANSGVSLGANRVRLLKIVEVRSFKSDGTVVTDTTPRVVYQQDSAAD